MLNVKPVRMSVKIRILLRACSVFKMIDENFSSANKLSPEFQTGQGSTHLRRSRSAQDGYVCASCLITVRADDTPVNLDPLNKTPMATWMSCTTVIQAVKWPERSTCGACVPYQHTGISEFPWLEVSRQRRYRSSDVWWSPLAWNFESRKLGIPRVLVL